MSLEECFDCCLEHKYDSKACGCDCTEFCKSDCEEERFELEKKFPAPEEEDDPELEEECYAWDCLYAEECEDECEDFPEDEPLCEEGQELYDSDCDPCAPEGEEFPC